ncbi:MAG: hypothetical protein LBU06_03355, partial [Desulfovibrio sp.]|nr:hypothetical protein [Desulfovibrio sp.]
LTCKSKRKPEGFCAAGRERGLRAGRLGYRIRTTVEDTMWTFLFIVLLVVLGIAAMRIAKPEYYSPRCCMGLAQLFIKEHEEKEKAACGKEKSDS